MRSRAVTAVKAGTEISDRVALPDNDSTIFAVDPNELFIGRRCRSPPNSRRREAESARASKAARSARGASARTTATEMRAARSRTLRHGPPKRRQTANLLLHFAPELFMRRGLSSVRGCPIIGGIVRGRPTGRQRRRG